MGRNNSYNFATLPKVNIQRSKFDRSSGHKTTFNTGDLIPIYIDEVLPGDSVSMNVAQLCRMSTPIFPVMDTAYLDTFFFFVPNRLVWEHWKEFNGENTSAPWVQTTEYQIPKLMIHQAHKGSLADYFGIPTEFHEFPGLTHNVSHLPFRAYCMIWNEWFRDQNLQSPVDIDISDSGKEYGVSDPPDPVTDAQRGAILLKANKLHDYFTSCLPSPQKGAMVQLPLGGDWAVFTQSKSHNLSSNVMTLRDLTDGASYSGKLQSLYASISNVGDGSGILRAVGEPTEPGPWVGDASSPVPDNLWAKPLSGATIADFRHAFQVQKLLERDARGGTRYIELLRSHFGVISDDARQQRPEYLGGNRRTIDMTQVPQNSSSNDVSPQGNLAAYSLTGHSGHIFTKSFTEHGYLIGLACVRTKKTYQQGIERFWSRTRRFDFYWPALANISEQPVYNKEIYAAEDAEGVFGYQEAWADYRYKPSRTSSAMRSTYENSLDAWHYGEHYESLPHLSSEWIAESPANVDRTIAVQSSLEDQFIADFYFNTNWVRPMPLYSVPGLVDHH